MSERPGVIARQPLVTTATVAALVSAVLSLLSAFGVPLSDAQQAAVSALAAVLAPVVVALVGYRLTTPTSDPRDSDGRPLVPLDWPSVPDHKWPGE